MKIFECELCGVVFASPTKGSAMYCMECRKKQHSLRVMQYRQRKNPAVRIGVGSGGNQTGERNNSFKDGLSHYRRVYDSKPDKSTVCEICGSAKRLHVHHINFNHKDNQPHNLQLVCKSCHSKIHSFANHLNSAEVKPTQNEELE